MLLRDSTSPMVHERAPLVVHVIFRLAIGGLENGLVNLINNMPQERYRHSIICLKDSTDFREKITREDVHIYELAKKDGYDFGLYFRLWKLFRKLRPQIVHTRNLGTIDALVPAALAGVKCRVHGEHGRDVSNLHGTNRKHLAVRMVFRPLVTKYIALSQDICVWLQDQVRVPPEYIQQIYNGVDSTLYSPVNGQRESLPIEEFADSNDIVIGTVGRMENEKDQLTLVHAFLNLLKDRTIDNTKLRLVIIGEGSLREKALSLLRHAGASKQAWLPGARSDTARILRGLDIFVLPSLIEGVSNTILEAMASGLPVVATAVGGNPELVVNGDTGFLVPPADPKAMAQALAQYIKDRPLGKKHGLAGRKRIETEFNMNKMVASYMEVYDRILES